MSLSVTHFTFGVGLLGGPGVGTTALVLRLKDDRFVSNQNVSTIHDSCLKVLPIDDKTVCKLRIYDNVFKENPGFTPVNLYRGISCAILVYSLSDKLSLFHVKAWADEYERNHGGVLFMMGNKCDEEREVPWEDADQLYDAIGCKKHFLVSAKTGEGIEAAFKEIAEYLVEDEQEDEQQRDIIMLGETNGTSTDTSSGSCGC
ncbi:uncharacterized protein [Amphiura filiformis]|uniref:uncharacterized protein n=1 Tax=Amphiura filiformis TaxID=82378 RepID=UPI003B223689